MSITRLGGRVRSLETVPGRLVCASICGPVARRIVALAPAREMHGAQSLVPEMEEPSATAPWHFPEQIATAATAANMLATNFMALLLRHLGCLRLDKQKANT